MTEQTRPPRDDRRRETTPAPTPSSSRATSSSRVPHARPRSRLREALVCPFCRDAVSRSGTVACARRGCGAVYHRECWEEVARDYGGCAVYGCGSKKSKEVSALGYVLWVLRLLLATLLFPPKVVRAVGRYQSGEGKSFWREGASMILWDADPNLPGYGDRAIRRILLICGGAFLAAVWGFFVLWYADRHHWQGEVGILLAASGVYILPFAGAIGIAVFFAGLNALAAVLKSEFAALARADDSGNSVLGRIRHGGGGKGGGGTGDAGKAR